MDKAVPCCQKPTALTNAPSPFSKLLVLGFYDGPTSGVLQCGTCSTVYKFDMLDWDDAHEVRIFRLASLPADSLDQCVQALAEPKPPRWPVWAWRTSSRSKLPLCSRLGRSRECSRIGARRFPASFSITRGGARYPRHSRRSSTQSGCRPRPKRAVDLQRPIADRRRPGHQHRLYSCCPLLQARDA